VLLGETGIELARSWDEQRYWIDGDQDSDVISGVFSLVLQCVRLKVMIETALKTPEKREKRGL
jgi:hypothetical protein